LRNGRDIISTDMKICFVSLDYPIKMHGSGAGVGTYYKTVAQQLSLLGHDIVVLALSPDNKPKEYHDGPVRVFFITITNFHWYISKVPFIKKLSLAVRELEYSYAAWKEIKRILEKEPLDIVQCTETGNFFLGKYHKKMSFRFVVRLHGEKYTIYKNRPDMKVGFEIWLYRYIQRQGIKKADYLMSPSQSHAGNISKEIKNAVEISVIPNFLDHQYIDKISYQDECENIFPSGEQIVFYAGRLEKGKGVWPLLEAASEVIKEFPSVQFLLAGNFHPTLSKTELMNYIQSMGINENVKILGYVPWEELFVLYKKSAIVAMPSYYETFGHTFLEGMFMSKPVIGFSGSSLEEIIEDGISGFIVERGNISALARAMVILLQDKELREKMGKAARKRAEERFTVSAIFPQLIKFYENIIRISYQR
jgi:glycosyltransferase involved in cell wall biosynthesis